jgi:hypothetical protein
VNPVSIERPQQTRGFSVSADALPDQPQRSLEMAAQLWHKGKDPIASNVPGGQKAIAAQALWQGRHGERAPRPTGPRGDHDGPNGHGGVFAPVVPRGDAPYSFRRLRDPNKTSFSCIMNTWQNLLYRTTSGSSWRPYSRLRSPPPQGVGHGSPSERRCPASSLCCSPLSRGSCAPKRGAVALA